MFRLMCFTLFLLFSQKMATAAEKPSIETLTRHVRLYFPDHYYYDSDRLEVEICQVDGLWEAMEVQILKVQLFNLMGGKYRWPPETVYLLYHDGSLSPLMQSFGHAKLTSGVVVNVQLYYSYTDALPASGMPTNTIVRLTIEDGRLSFMYLPGGAPPSLYVGAVDGRAQVRAGQFDNFNNWKYETPVGWLKLEKSGLVQAPELAIVDDFGDAIGDLNPYALSWLNSRPRWIVMCDDAGDMIISDRVRIESPELLGNRHSHVFPAACHPIDVADHSVEFATDVDPPLGECKPHECWMDLAGDKEERVAALFRIRE